MSVSTAWWSAGSMRSVMLPPPSQSAVTTAGKRFGVGMSSTWQVPMGSITEPVLKHCGFQTYRIEREEDVEPITESACRMAFGGGNMQVAILLSQRMTDRNKPKSH